MKEKHPIDRLFQEANAQRKYPYKEEYWASALELIEEEPARKKRRFFGLFLLLGLLAGTSALVWMYLPGTKGETLSQTQGEALSLDTPHTLVLTDALDAETANLQLLQAETMLETEDPVEQIQQQRSSTHTVPGIEQRTETKSRNILRAATETNSYSSKRGEGTEDGSMLAPKQAAAEEGGRSRVLNGLLSESTLQDLAHQPLADALPVAIPAGQQIQISVAPLENPFDQLIDQNASHAAPKMSYIPQGRGKHRLGISFGYAVNQAIGDKTEQQQSLGMSPVLGLAYTYTLSRRFRLESGLRYTQMPALAGDSTYTSTDFYFGAEIEGINIRPLALHQLEVPLQVNWSMGPRSRLSAGTYFRYLINVQSEVSTFESNPFETQPGPIRKAWGYKQGFRRMDMGLSLGYRYLLSEGLSLGIAGQYGLMDVRDNLFYRENSFDRNLNVRLILRYNFGRF